MQFESILRTIIVLGCFAIIILFTTLSVGFSQLKDQWPMIRCNPMAMPFASAFGFDTSENFTYCVQDMQTKYLTYLLQPLNYNFGVIGTIASSTLESLDNVRKFLSNIRTFIGDIVGGIFGVFLNILVEVQRLTINIKDMIAKLVGILAVVMYTIDGSMKTLNSTWRGPPGQLVSALCFHPKTKVMLKNGKIVMMKNIKLNSVLQNGSVVNAVLTISNTDTIGNYKEKLYSIKGGVNKSCILVTGSHLILDPTTNKYIQVKDFNESIVSETICDTFSCLVTSDHTIPIGTRIFHDWEDYHQRELLV